MMGHCSLCAKLVLQAEEIDCDTYKINCVIVSHMYVANLHQSGTIKSYYSEDCTLVPCFRIKVDADTIYCASEQWYCSD